MSFLRVLKKTAGFSPEKLSNLIAVDNLYVEEMDEYIIFRFSVLADEQTIRKKLWNCGCQSLHLSNRLILKIIKKLSPTHQFKDFSYGLDVFNRNILLEIEKNMVYDQNMFRYLSCGQGIDSVIQCIETFIADWEVDITKIVLRGHVEPHDVLEIYRSLIFKMHTHDDITKDLKFVREVLDMIEQFIEDDGMVSRWDENIVGLQ